MAEEEDDDLELVETGLIFLGNNRYDLYELYRKMDDNSNDFVFGRYEIKNIGFVAGRAFSKEGLSTNLSSIAKMRQRGLHRLRGAQVKVFKNRLYLN